MFEKIAILGAGHGGHAMSAELSQMGFQVNLYEHPKVADKLNPIIEKGGIDVIAKVPSGEYLDKFAGGKSGFVKITGKITSDIKKAVKGVDLIMLVVPSHVREVFIKILAPCLEDGQTILVWPGYFGALQVAAILKDEGVNKDIIICETESLMYACRITGPAQVTIMAKKRKMLVAAFPGDRTEQIVKELKKVFPGFLAAKNIMDTTLGNVNTVLHPQSVLLNLYRVERKFYPYFDQIGGPLTSCYDITPGSAKVMEAVDKEKIALGKKLGVKIPALKDILKDFYGAEGKDLYETVLDCYAYQKQVGPSTLEHRYVVEDVPFALVPIAYLGDQLGVPVPTTKGMVAIANAATKKDFWNLGFTMKKLGLAGKSAEEIKEYIETGNS
ncbi:MAG: NAD/NADP octopine/nopaline dehydrogenase family protein [Actinobacteria bacterium]|nr:NAD/NADP octopine/nopaline dehydrogenase family protein [Actinomycetota bacterium]